MKTKIANLIETRKIMALAIILVFAILAIRGSLQESFVQTVIISIISFYFGKSTALDPPKSTKRQ
jgi:hypothetical protein